MLTARQHALLCYIHAFQRDNGFSPSFEEMKCGLGLTSKSHVMRLVDGLSERGFMRRRVARARSIEILRMPGDDNEIAALRAALRDAVAGAADWRQRHRAVIERATA